MQITNISDAKANLSQLIRLVQENNQTIIIGKAGKPIAVLSAYKEDNTPRILGGSWQGNVIINDDASDTDIADSFYNTSIFSVFPAHNKLPLIRFNRHNRQTIALAD